jgi:hypothetical protein
MAHDVEVDHISAFFADPEKVTEALARGVREALLQHKRAGNPIAIWHDEKVVWVPAEDIPVEEGDLPKQMPAPTKPTGPEKTG